ncbi:PspC domain-containing protein [Paenibacillus sp. CAU 1782]
MVVLKTLYRSRRDKKILGLCGGLSQMLNVDATLIRILLIVITVLTSGTVILIYLIAGMVVPKEPPIYGGHGPGGYGGGYGGHGGHGGFGNPGHPGGFGQGGAPGGFDPRSQGFGAPPPPAGSAGNGNWTARPNPQTPPPANADFDTMMDDLEKKALRREIEELKAKMAKYEKGES